MLNTLDEVLTEVPISNLDDLNAAAHDQETDMVNAMREILPDMKGIAESCLMTRWFKHDGVRDASGRLIVLDDAYIRAELEEKKKKAKK